MRKNYRKDIKFIPTLLHEFEFEDVDRLLELNKSINKLSLGKGLMPSKNALLRGSIVLIVARIEKFVEELFEWAAEKVFKNLTEDELIQYYKISSRKFNTPNSDNINKLFLGIGFSNIMSKIHHDSAKNKVIVKKLVEIVNKRHDIAHGKIGGMLRADRKFSATTNQVVAWKDFAVKFMYQLEKVVSTILYEEKYILKK